MDTILYWKSKLKRNKKERVFRLSLYRLSKNSVLRNKCRGEHCSSAEKQSFSDFSKGNSPVFRLAATDFALQNLRTTDGRPYEWLF